MPNVQFQGKSVPVVKKLPKQDVSAGEMYAIKSKNKGRYIIFRKTSKTGFRSWQLIGNVLG